MGGGRRGKGNGGGREMWIEHEERGGLSLGIRMCIL